MIRSGICLVAFTISGTRLAQQLAQAMETDCQVYAPAQHCVDGVHPLAEPIGQWTARWFHRVQALVFIGAAGIAVRSIAPLVQSKGSDPAVLCLDETGQFVIPLLSGHIGGANALAVQIASITGGQAVITTATDVQNVFSPDVWAVEQNCAIPNTSQIKAVSAALLRGEAVGICSAFPLEGTPPLGLVRNETLPCGIHIALEQRQVFAHTLWLVPRCLTLGIGCRKNISLQDLQNAVQQMLTQNQLPVQAVQSVGTISLKAQEPALLQFCEEHNLPLKVYTPEELAGIEGSSASSAFVEQVVGVDNVCERAALANGGVLFVQKTVLHGVTVAVAKQEWRASF